MAKRGAYMSVVPSNAKPRIFRHGGNRDRAGRVTCALSAKDVENLTLAMKAAYAIGLPLNRFVTVHWERAGIAPRKAAWATGQFLKYTRDWLASKGLPFANVWIRENDDGDGSKGDHVHIALHIPKGITIGHRQQRWLRAITGKPYCKGVIKTGRVGGTANAATASPEHYQDNLAYIAGYVLKGASKGDLGAFSIGRWGEGGRVVGQRCGMSKNLSRLIRQRPIHL